MQDLQEPAPAECREAVASGGVAHASVHDVDVVPAHQLVLERRVHHRVGVLDPAERLVGEHDTEAEGVVGGVALPDGDLTALVEALEQRGGVQPAGTAADDGDTHRRARPRRHGYRPRPTSARASP